MPFCEYHKIFYKHQCSECLYQLHKNAKNVDKILEKRNADIEKAKIKASQPKPTPNKISKKQKEKLAEYNARVKVWKVENPKCKANCNEYCTKETDDNHHQRGRGKYFMDESTWLPCCRSCHNFIEQHPKEAYEKGWSKSRLEVFIEPHIL